MSTFRPSSWFKKLFGFKESVELVAEHITSKKDGENYVLTSKNNNMSYNAGNFHVRNISSFLDDPNKCPIRNGGTLNILCGNGPNTINYEQIDALAMQSLPMNDGATYLAASNFNCLEFVSSTQTASEGVKNYIYDQTQGPYTALACPQCAAFRNYFVEFQDENGHNIIGQLDTQINLLSKTPIKVINGYAVINKKDSRKLANSDFNWDDENNYAVGVHNDCEVIMARSKNGRFAYLGKKDESDDAKDSKTKKHHHKQKELDTENNNKFSNSMKDQELSNGEDKKKIDLDINDDVKHSKTKKHHNKHKKQNKENNKKNSNNKTHQWSSNDNKEKKINLDENEDIKRTNVSNHVYAASFNFKGHVCRNDFTLKIASSILKAEYKAAVLAGWENSVKMEAEKRAASHVLYLTLLGGGVFGNPFEIIADAIISCKEEIMKSGLEVWVVCYDDCSFNEVRDILMPVVEETGGTVEYVD